MEANANSCKDSSRAGSHISLFWLFLFLFFPLAFPVSWLMWFFKRASCCTEHLGLKREGKHIPGLVESFWEENRKADRNRGKAVLYLVGISGSLNMGHTQCMIYWGEALNIHKGVLANDVNFQTLCFVSFTNVKSIIRKSRIDQLKRHMVISLTKKKLKLKMNF